MGLIRCKNGHLFSEKKHGYICPYCNTAVNKNSNQEEDPLGRYSDVVYLNDLEVLKPVTGWLVCLEGGFPRQGLPDYSGKKFCWPLWRYGDTHYR